MWWHSRVTALCLCLQVIAQTSPALIYQISSPRRSRPRLNWLLKSPWEQKCQRRTLATSGTCVIRCVCSLFATVTVMAMTVVCCKHRVFCASLPFVTHTLHSWICFWMFSLCFFLPQVVEISEYRAQLYDYLKNRMMAIAPNLTVMVGELVGARLISHAGEFG